MPIIRWGIIGPRLIVLGGKPSAYVVPDGFRVDQHAVEQEADRLDVVIHLPWAPVMPTRSKPRMDFSIGPSSGLVVPVNRKSSAAGADDVGAGSRIVD